MVSSANARQRSGQHPTSTADAGSSPQPELDPSLIELADVLHSFSIHLLRRAREADPESGLSPARLSTLSVLVFAGHLKLHELAAHEQVRPATMTRLVDALETGGYVERSPHPDDRRAVLIKATVLGLATLRAARQERLVRIARDLELLSARQRNMLRKAVPTLSQLGRLR